jgi:hypothetical protein
MLSAIVIEMITAEDIKAIFESSDFRTDLEELSSYAANIRQERPIVDAGGYYTFYYSGTLEAKIREVS